MDALMASCALCKREIRWYGEGEAPRGPCCRCDADLERVDVDPDRLFEAAKISGWVRVIRRRTIVNVVTREEPRATGPEVRVVITSLVPGKTKDGYRRLRTIEHLLVDDFGQHQMSGSLYGRLEQDPEIHVLVDRTWTGSF